MTKQSDDFEKQITRIHELLDGSNAEVTWDDKIPDPDNPKQDRQIDFTIKNHDSFVIGECRFRKQPQGTPWIEELIGRKISFNADGVIAVSASGFTEGAINKAKKYGIVLRNFFEITEQELETWGKRTSASIIFVKLTELTFSFPLSTNNTAAAKLTNEQGEEMPLLGFLQGIAHKVDDLKPKNNPTNFCIDGTPENLFFNGEKLQYIQVSGKMEKYQEALSLLSVFCYSETKDVPSGKDEAFIQKLDMAQSEVIAHGDNVSVLFDCSEMDIPKNTLFYGGKMDFGKVVNMSGLEFLGIENAFKGVMDIKYEILPDGVASNVT